MQRFWNDAEMRDFFLIVVSFEQFNVVSRFLFVSHHVESYQLVI